MGGKVKFVTDPKDPALQQFGMTKGVQDAFFGGPRQDMKQSILGVGAPPPAPDLADLNVRQAGLAERNKQLANKGRRSSFLGGDYGEAPIERKTLLGQ